MKTLGNKCGGCNFPLESLNEDDVNPQNQYVDAMDLVFTPGYGELIDGDQQVRFALCKHCSTNLFNLMPGLKEKLEYHSDSYSNLIEDARKALRNRSN